MPKFAANIRAEAEEQRRLRAAGLAIPPEAKRYARKAGLGVAALTWSVTAGLALVAYYEGKAYVTLAGAFFVLGAIGVAQVVTGLHIITGNRKR